jgi:hypothetical protein
MDGVVNLVTEQLAASNLAIVDDFLARVGFPGLATTVRKEIEENFLGACEQPVLSHHTKAGMFQRGELAGSEGFWTTRYDEAKRNDLIYWLQRYDIDSRPLPALRTYLNTIQQLADGLLASASTDKAKLSGLDLRGARELSCDRLMLAVYPTTYPSYFKMHVDNPNNNGRILSVVLYLNEGWNSSANGGQLKLRTKSSETLVDPIHDRLLVFYADHRCPHEVLPTMPSPGASLFRFSVVSWLSYLAPEEVLNAYKGAFAGWISRIKSKKAEKQNQ